MIMAFSRAGASYKGIEFELCNKSLRCRARSTGKTTPEGGQFKKGFSDIQEGLKVIYRAILGIELLCKLTGGFIY